VTSNWTITRNRNGNRHHIHRQRGETAIETESDRERQSYVERGGQLNSQTQMICRCCLALAFISMDVAYRLRTHGFRGWCIRQIQIQVAIGSLSIPLSPPAVVDLSAPYIFCQARRSPVCAVSVYIADIDLWRPLEVKRPCNPSHIIIRLRCVFLYL